MSERKEFIKEKVENLVRILQEDDEVTSAKEVTEIICSLYCLNSQILFANGMTEDLFKMMHESVLNTCLQCKQSNELLALVITLCGGFKDEDSE
jgi:flagellar biosynthesis regulator FlbT